jgi:hypothetical protein
LFDKETTAVTAQIYLELFFTDLSGANR